MPSRLTNKEHQSLYKSKKGVLSLNRNKSSPKNRGASVAQVPRPQHGDLVLVAFKVLGRELWFDGHVIAVTPAIGRGKPKLTIKFKKQRLGGVTWDAEVQSEIPDKPTTIKVLRRKKR